MSTPSSTPEPCEAVADGDAAQAIAVLAWAQRHGLQVSTVSVGTCRVELHRVSAPDPAQREPGVRRPSIYELALQGNKELAQAIEDSGIPMGELQPAVGR